MKHDFLYRLLFVLAVFLLIIVAPILHPIGIIKAELERRKIQS